MLYFFDTEFIESPGRLDLISIGIVSEDNREYYAISKEFNPKLANSWVVENVLNSLPPKNPMPTEVSPRLWEESKAWKSREDIMLEVADFMGCSHHVWAEEIYGIAGLWNKLLCQLNKNFDKRVYEFYLPDWKESPEIWGEWSSYDWVCFAQLFGEMSKLPKGFPVRCRDIIQLAEDELSIPANELPASLETPGNHNALLGAKTVKMRYEWLQKNRSEKNIFSG